MKIRTKIIASTGVVVCVSLLFSGFFTYHYATGIIREQSVNDTKTKLSQTAAQIRRFQETAIKTAEYVISDEEINALLIPRENPTLEEAHFIKHDIGEKLKRFTSLNANIYNIMIVRSDGQVFSNNSGFDSYFADYLQEAWFTDFKRRPARTGFSVPHDFNRANMGTGYQKVISYIAHYKNMLDKSSAEYDLVLDIAYSEIAGAFGKGMADFEQVLLLNEYGDLLFAGKPLTGSGSFGIADKMPPGKGGYAEDRNTIMLTDNSMKDWVQVAVISKERLFAKINNILYVYLIIIAAGLIVTLAMMLPIIWSITNPISRLTQAMKRVSVGDLGTSITIRSGDEMEILGNGFNRMVGELKELIATSVKDEETKRRMQMNLLISQINPHFIYNTLNTVIYLSHDARGGDVAKITEALIAILQDTIKTGDGADFSMLREEVAVIEKYIDIQRYRYPDRFSVEWRFEEGTETAVVPRMIIQPIVENALFHGLQPSEKPGLIRIRTAKEDGQLVIEVEDNGVGMDERTLNGIFQTSSNGRPTNQTRGIGLANIKERLHYYYGPAFRADIRSEPQSGTKVTIRVPFHESSPSAAASREQDENASGF
ncbi:sensor histidine kinase [Paenibacillus hamazuiensis]|uniref:sensor histidine kinase n=1 Tax=Paenibacillus hamazuiensis TaxID=2936508 RepID=UPI00200ECB48|nr:sensor histidine kinase [Paenibacillus hamazuiensis]